jgi:hypothetical protein
MQRLKSAMRTNGALELYRADHRQKIVLTRRFWLNFLGSSIWTRQHLSPTLSVLQEVGPILHHLCASFEMEGVIVGCAYGIPCGMG